MTGNETADSNDYFSHNNKPHPLPVYSKMKIFYSAKNIIQEFSLSFKFHPNSNLFSEAHAKASAAEGVHKKSKVWPLAASGLTGRFKQKRNFLK